MAVKKKLMLQLFNPSIRLNKKKKLIIETKNTTTSTAQKADFKFDYPKSLKLPDFKANLSTPYWWIRLPNSSEKKFNFAEKSEMSVSEYVFRIKKGTQNHIFPFSEVNEIKTVHHKMMLPLLLGGISSPLFFASMLKSGIFNNWFALILAVLAAVFFTIGFQGKNRIEIHALGKTHFFDAWDNPQVNTEMKKLNQKIKIYHQKQTQNT